jgi:EthD domain
MIGRLTQWQPRGALECKPLSLLGSATRSWSHACRACAATSRTMRYPRRTERSRRVRGVGEAWFDDATAARAALQSPEWAAVIEDAQTFMDLETVVATWVEPRLVRDL